MKTRLKATAELLLLTTLVLGIQLGMMTTGIGEKKIAQVQLRTSQLAVQNGGIK